MQKSEVVSEYASRFRRYALKGRKGLSVEEIEQAANAFAAGSDAHRPGQLANGLRDRGRRE